MHAWAVLELFEARSALVGLLHSISQGKDFLPAALSLIQQIPNGVGLLVICAVVFADIWTFAGGSAWSEDQAESETPVSGTSKRGGRRYFRIGAALGLFVLMVAITFNLAGPGRIVLTASVFAIVALLAMFLLLLRVESSARVVLKLQEIQRHLDSADEHLKKIDGFRQPNAPVT